MNRRETTKHCDRVRRSFAPAAVLLLVLNGGLMAQSPGIRRGQETTLEVDAPWALWFTVVLLLTAGLVTYGLYWREHAEAPPWVKVGLASLRFALVCIILWMMYGATLRPYRTDLPDLLFVVDDSTSMATIDEIEVEELRTLTDSRLASLDLKAATRLNHAKSLLLENDSRLLKRLQSGYQLKLATLSSVQIYDESDFETTLRQLQPRTDSSPLGKAVSQSLRRERGRPVAAVVMLTDGITTSGPPISTVAEEAGQRGIPLHLVGIGSPEPAKDLRLSDLLVDDVVFLGDLITFDLQLFASGFAEEDVEVTLRHVGELGIADRQQLLLSEARESRSVRLAYRPEREGSLEFVIETPVRPGEVQAENNVLRCVVEVRDDTTKVLLVQSYPSFEFRYLKTLLGRSQGNAGGELRQPVELQVLLQDADPEFADIDATALRTFPTRAQLFEYDVCIFGDVNPSFLGTESLRNLRDFVRQRGRGFVGIAGPRYLPAAYADTPLGDLLPFEVAGAIIPPNDVAIEAGFRPRLTPLATRFPSMQLSVDPNQNKRLWSELPELYWLLEIESLKPGVRVLSEHPTRVNTAGQPLPVTTLSYVGAGKVLFHATDESWRWRIARGDELFGRYWLQTLRYLSRFKLGEGREVELTSDRDTYRRGESVRLRARFFDDRLAPEDDQGVSVLVEQKGRGQRRVDLQRDPTSKGLFIADVANLGTGDYHAWVAQPVTSEEAPSVDFKIEAPQAEMSRLEMDAPDLRRAAKVSAGEFYTLETAETLIDKLPVGRQVRIEALPPETIWNSWEIALLFVSLLVAEWLLRRRVGMV